LECSGKHRGLGVHLSFVRSINMDKWKELELEKMRVGGNKPAREFFESQPDCNPSWTLQEKYNSRAAALLRDKVSFRESPFLCKLYFAPTHDIFQSCAKSCFCYPLFVVNSAVKYDKKGH
uniref:Arf-GAP domain-containing protein n=1 Tax=Echinostoma caproni TaxID=27848 RepID=A0A183B0W1_9TREM